MPTRAIVPLVAFLVLIASAATAGKPADGDAFLAAHRASLALNQPRGFEIRFKGGRTTFNPREPIEIELVFDPPDPLYDGVGAGPCRGFVLDDVIFDDMTGVAEPQRAGCRDYFEAIPGGVPGCVPGGTIGGIFDAPKPKPPPKVLTLTLNDWYRFDRPGTLRFFVRSAHFIGYVSPSPRQTSNILTLTLTARDPAFERARARAVAAELGDPSTPIERRRAALRELRQLASEEALPVLAPLLDSKLAEEAPGVVVAALLAVPDRRATIDALHRELLRPERTIGGAFVRDLAALRVLDELGVPHGQAEARYLALIAEIGRERARVLDAEPGRLEAAFRDELREAGAHEGFFYVGALAAVAREHPREVTSAFLSLDAVRQRHLLRHSWRRFAVRGFLPLLRRVYAKPADDAADLRDIALVRLKDLAPREARAAARTELRQAIPRVPVSTLARIVHVAELGLETRWGRTLATSDDEAELLAAAERLERLGTAASAASVTRIWNSRWKELPLDASAAAVAFLARVDPPAAARAVRTALTGSEMERGDRREQEGFLLRVGRLRWVRAFERVAIGALAHEEWVVRHDAMQLLSANGSRAARAALEARLAARLPPEPRIDIATRYADDPEAFELASALVSARHWRLTDEEMAVWDRRCGETSCATSFYVRSSMDWSPSEQISVSGPLDGNEGDVSFRTTHSQSGSLDDLLDKLGLFPPRTPFYWSDHAISTSLHVERWTRAERAALFEQARRRAVAKGIVLTRTMIRSGTASASVD
jgi:hypothetical protein